MTTGEHETRNVERETSGIFRFDFLVSFSVAFSLGDPGVLGGEFLRRDSDFVIRVCVFALLTFPYV